MSLVSVLLVQLPSPLPPLSLTLSLHLCIIVMGCVFSQEFVIREDVPGQDSLAHEMFQKLHLTKKDIDILYTAFCDMDADSRLVVSTSSS
jgi:hypothetical protein